MISSIVLTKDEEKNIKSCLDSLGWCDEIVVIDDYSKDKTVKIARRLGAKVYQHHLNGNFAAQRNFGLKKAKGEWILFVDADERVSASLAAEIKTRLLKVYSQDPDLKIESSQPVGFYFKRQDWFGGKWLKYGETATVRLLRLAKRGGGEWKRKVHEVWEIKGKVEELRNPLLHYPHPTISQFLNQINFYSTLHAEALAEEGVKPSLFRLVTNPLGKFLQNYFLRLGFLDGLPGLIVTLMMSFHSFLAQAKLYQQRLKRFSSSGCLFGFIPFRE